MIRLGEAPYLECSSRGDRRFSAFYARIKARENVSIEKLYQESKIFSDGKGRFWMDAKGMYPTNMEEVKKLYSQLWDEYIQENPELLSVLKEASGLSDIFGQAGHVCQATELWRIRNSTA